VSILWPAHLFASLPAACCADLAGPWTLNPQDPSILGGGVAVWYTTSIFGLHIPDCTGAGSWSFNIDVTCEPAGGGLGNVWVIRLSGTMFDGQSGVAQQLTSLSCLPMHLRLANQNIVNPNPATLGVWCVGSTPVEITQ
jgi:hypothetical protein